MDAQAAIESAKTYIGVVYADEGVGHVGLEETEHDVARGLWIITLSFAREWNTPRTRAQEVLENLGAMAGRRGAIKVVTVAEDGSVISMKNKVYSDAIG